jgi:hypothetical protein
MKTTTRRLAYRITASSLVLAMLSLSTVQAADVVQWNDLPKKIGRGKIRSDNREDRQYRVVTSDGQIYMGYQLRFSQTDVGSARQAPSFPAGR